jgi:threonine/homoserine/homoserine lactone efflux protein
MIGPFLAVTIPLVITPGASTAVVVRNSIGGGVRAGFETALGMASASFSYGLLCAFGLAVALQNWPSVWMALRFGGVAYLFWLGLQSLRRAIWPPPPIRTTVDGPDRRSATAHIYEGYLTNALNPSLATFYLVLLPQFVPRGGRVAANILILTCIHVALAGAWHLVWSLFAGTMARTLSSGRPRRVLELVTAVALIWLAVKIGINPITPDLTARIGVIPSRPT